MARPTTVDELSPRVFLALRNAVEHPGIRLEYNANRAREGFNFEAGFERGVLYYCGSTPVDAITHEAGHALLLRTRDRIKFSENHGDFDPMMVSYGWLELSEPSVEELVMYLQVEVSRRVPGMGVRWAIGQMEAAGYTFLTSTRGYECQGYTWWRTCKHSIQTFIRENCPWIYWALPDERKAARTR
jgi:hypothetical protein